MSTLRIDGVTTAACSVTGVYGKLYEIMILSVRAAARASALVSMLLMMMMAGAEEPGAARKPWGDPLSALVRTVAVAAARICRYAHR